MLERKISSGKQTLIRTLSFSIDNYRIAMKITQILAWQVDLPLIERYTLSNDRHIDVLDVTVVEIKTDSGISGFGECCPLGSAYLPSYAAGVRAGIAEIAPHLIGKDPRNLNDINRTMNRTLLGHPYVKSPLDVACWDLLGKANDSPVYEMLGGSMQESYALYRSISKGSPDEMASGIKIYLKEGYRQIQLKVGENVNEDIERIRAARSVMNPADILVADGNRGWTQHEAARVVDAIADIDVYIEQPCSTYKECLSIRNRTGKPFILDESVQSIEDLLQGISDDALDVLVLKISKVGGLSVARVIRDICISSGIPMRIEDTWGSDIITAAYSHLARSTPEEFCFAVPDLNTYNTVSIASGVVERSNGRNTASDCPGLGIEPIFETLGSPVLEIGL